MIDPGPIAQSLPFGQVERMRAEACGIAQTADQEAKAALNPVLVFW
jgi:hypothetical protein